MNAIKNIFYDKVDLRLLHFRMTIYFFKKGRPSGSPGDYQVPPKKQIK